MGDGGGEAPRDDRRARTSASTPRRIGRPRHGSSRALSAPARDVGGRGLLVARRRPLAAAARSFLNASAPVAAASGSSKPRARIESREQARSCSHGKRRQHRPAEPCAPPNCATRRRSSVATAAPRRRRLPSTLPHRRAMAGRRRWLRRNASVASRAFVGPRAQPCQRSGSPSADQREQCIVAGKRRRATRRRCASAAQNASPSTGGRRALDGEARRLGAAQPIATAASYRTPPCVPERATALRAGSGAPPPQRGRRLRRRRSRRHRAASGRALTFSSGAAATRYSGLASSTTPARRTRARPRPNTNAGARSSSARDPAYGFEAAPATNSNGRTLMACRCARRASAARCRAERRACGVSQRVERGERARDDRDALQKKTPELARGSVAPARSRAEQHKLGEHGQASRARTRPAAARGRAQSPLPPTAIARVCDAPSHRATAPERRRDDTSQSATPRGLTPALLVAAAQARPQTRPREASSRRDPGTSGRRDPACGTPQLGQPPERHRLADDPGEELGADRVVRFRDHRSACVRKACPAAAEAVVFVAVGAVALVLPGRARTSARALSALSRAEAERERDEDDAGGRRGVQAQTPQARRERLKRRCMDAVASSRSRCPRHGRLGARKRAGARRRRARGRTAGRPRAAHARGGGGAAGKAVGAERAARRDARARGRSERRRRWALRAAGRSLHHARRVARDHRARAGRRAARRRRRRAPSARLAPLHRLLAMQRGGAARSTDAAVSALATPPEAAVRGRA